MARCGITRRYPVKIVTVADDGGSDPGIVIGTAEFLGQALALGERQGFLIRDEDDGGHSRFVLDPGGGSSHFIVTVYPS
jgi:hypothetical protein